MQNRFTSWFCSAKKKVFASRPAWIPPVYYVTALVLLALNGCSAIGGRQTTPTPIPPPVIPVKPVYEVQVGEITRLVKFTGRIAPVREVELAFGTNGRVDQVLVESGDTVQAGELLAMLDTGSQKYNLRRAEIDLELAQFDLNLARQQQPVASQANSLEVVRKEQALEQAQMVLDGLTRAGHTGSTLQQAQDNLELAQLELDITRQQAALDALESETSLSVKERQVELAQIALNEIQDFIADTQILAPFDGQVVSVYVKEDTAAEAFRTAVILVDIAGWEIRASPADTQLQVLEEGMPVSISTIAEPGTAQDGKVSSLPYPYGSGEASEEEARIDLEPGFSLGEYELGDLMQITVIIAQKSNALWLPPQAIRTFEGRKFVVIKEGEGQRRVDIKIGIQSEDRVEILEGLEQGQFVFSP